MRVIFRKFEDEIGYHRRRNMLIQICVELWKILKGQMKNTVR